MTNYSYAHNNEPAVIIITADSEKDANSILNDLVRLPHLWRLDDAEEVDNLDDVKKGK